MIRSNLSRLQIATYKERNPEQRQGLKPQNPRCSEECHIRQPSFQPDFNDVAGATFLTLDLIQRLPPQCHFQLRLMRYPNLFSNLGCNRGILTLSKLTEPSGFGLTSEWLFLCFGLKNMADF
jgi:hypothetical protein